MITRREIPFLGFLIICLLLSNGCKKEEAAEFNPIEKHSERSRSRGDAIPMNREDIFKAEVPDVRAIRVQTKAGKGNRIIIAHAEHITAGSRVFPAVRNTVTASILPYWKRELLKEVEAEKRELLAHGKSELAEVVGKSTYYKRLQEWNAKHGSEFMRLDAQREEIIRRRFPDPVPPEVTRELLNRLGEVDPVVGERDIVALESLIPSDGDLANPVFYNNLSVQRLIELHAALAGVFPYSVSRKGLAENLGTIRHR